MFEIDYRAVLYALLVLGCLGTLALSRDRTRSGFLFFICTLGLGWRTFHVTQMLSIHPAEVIIWILFVCCLGRPRPRQNKKAENRLPGWLWIFIPFWILAWLPVMENSRPWDVQVSEFRNFLLLIPLFLVTPAVLATGETWRLVLLTMYGVGVWIAAMGLAEYVFPGIASLLPGFVSNPSALIAADGFERARFSFYGSPVAVYVCILALPMGLLVWRWWPATWPRAITLGGALLQVAAIYVAGNRAIWLLTGVLLFLFVGRRKRAVLGLIVLLLALVGYEIAYHALPQVTQARLHSLAMILEGRPIDSSGVKRWARVTTTLSEAWEWPFGRGWAAVGWVHSDFLQVAANLGIIPGLVFVGAYAWTLWRVWLRARSQHLPDDTAAVGHALFLSFLAAGVILMFEVVVSLPQLVLPVWLVWALVETWLWQTSPSPKAAANRNGRAWSTLQHRGYRLPHSGMKVLGKG